jgi:GMP synthase-like glutamine amidotransferase
MGADMRVAIVENTKVTHHGQVGVALHEKGALIDLYRPFLNGEIPKVGSYDALVVFGGEQSARDDAAHPFMPHLADHMAQAASDGAAVLGICLGSQILARGLGAQNHIGTAPEFGWCAMDRVGEDPMFAALPAQFRAFQWHSDTFTLPQGAAYLAQGGRALVQAFRFGRAGYGTQFHFEANRNVVADWTRRFPDAISGMDAAWARSHSAQEAAHGAAADAAGLALARAWVALI